MLYAALRRLAFISLVAVGFTVVVSLFIGLLAGSGIDRALTLGFYIVGSFLLVAGFFVGNRGPVRVKAESAGPVIVPVPGFGQRTLRWATQNEQNETINNSAVFICLGVLLVVVGVAFDSHHSLF